ncbi:hypothetical protein OG473_39405 (plasmid) [Streptomyces anulatus]|uniref:hypothetical protein n=1 Tax=Streptomyces anulatus TaxID=1892 RepID=UPI00324EBA72
MTEPQHNVAPNTCDHAYEVRILGGHPLSVRLCTLCRTPDWTDLYEQADALFRWGREEGLAGKPSRTTISAYDRPTETDDKTPGHVYLLTPGYRSEDDGAAALRKRITALHEPVQRMGQAWCGECSVRRSTGPTTEEWVALIPHPCPTIDVLDSIDEQESKDPCEGDTDENGAWHSVWLHGKWESLTRRMSTAEREYAADRVASYSRHLAECDNDPERGEPTGLRWWREAGR